LPHLARTWTGKPAARSTSCTRGSGCRRCGAASLLAGSAAERGVRLVRPQRKTVTVQAGRLPLLELRGRGPDQRPTAAGVRGRLSKPPVLHAHTRRYRASSAAASNRSRFAGKRHALTGSSLIRREGADCGSGAQRGHCGRAGRFGAHFSVRWAARIGEDHRRGNG